MDDVRTEIGMHWLKRFNITARYRNLPFELLSENLDRSP